MAMLEIALVGGTFLGCINLPFIAVVAPKCQRWAISRRSWHGGRRSMLLQQRSPRMDLPAMIYLSPERCIEYHTVDKIVPPRSALPGHDTTPAYSHLLPSTVKVCSNLQKKSSGASRLYVLRPRQYEKRVPALLSIGRRPDSAGRGMWQSGGTSAT